jgi:hypothetical protein
LLADFIAFRVCVVSLLDLLVRVLDLTRLKRRPPAQQRVHDHADRPVVHLERVTAAAATTPAHTLAVEDFRSDVVRRAANGLFALALVLELGGQTEISHLDLHRIGQEKVAQL